MEMRKTIIEYVADCAASNPEKLAVMTPDDSVSYGELYDYAKGYAKHLVSSGLERGDIVVLKAAQTIEYAIQYLGIHLAGGVVTSLGKTVSDNEMVEVADNIGAAAIITDSTLAEKAFIGMQIPQGDVRKDASSHIDDCVELRFPDLADSADILFTTGTTGISKGVELSHRALVATAENLIFGCGYRNDTVIVVPGPLNHANAIRKVFTSFINGSSVCILNGVADTEPFFSVLDSADGSIACCLPPAAIRKIFQLTKDKIGEYRDRIDFIESASAPLPEADKDRLCELLPKTRLYNNYGSSEAASSCMYDYNHFRGKDNCVGKAMPNSKIIIVDDDHNEIRSSKNKVGLIACGGDGNMKGYVNDPTLTLEAMKDGIVYTNDLGYIDDEGFVYVIGRKDDVINVGGLKVAPSEVESAVLAYNGIADCICIAIDDEITANALKLLVVMEEGAELDFQYLTSFLSERLEAFQIPRVFEDVNKIERTYNGKLNRKFYRQ